MCVLDKSITIVFHWNDFDKQVLYAIYIEQKSLQAINAGEGVEKKEPSYTVGGNANQYSHYEEQ